MSDFEDLSHNDADVIYSVAGYVTSVIKCDCFEPPATQEDNSHFLAMTRGGWTVPQPCDLILRSGATSAFNSLLKKDKKHTFLNLKHHRPAFVSALKSLLVKQIIFLERYPHVDRILRSFFNCLAKNLKK